MNSHVHVCSLYSKALKMDLQIQISPTYNDITPFDTIRQPHPSLKRHMYHHDHHTL